MKKVLLLMAVFTAFVASDVVAQEKPLSPKETVKGTINDVNIEVVYSRPSARGRKMIGGNEPFGTVWRTGANEATTIEFSKAVKIEGKELPAGKYTLFTIPNEKEWTIIFNSQPDQWGAYSYEETKAKDVLKVTVPAGKTPSFVETFTISVEKDNVSLKWENTSVSVKVKG